MNLVEEGVSYCTIKKHVEAATKGKVRIEFVY